MQARGCPAVTSPQCNSPELGISGGSVTMAAATSTFSGTLASLLAPLGGPYGIGKLQALKEQMQVRNEQRSGESCT